ncbi:hypothetical protein PRK78_006280 [Emydomyces testavorans]|uniref:Uncharacterized protein n=1 Tax=Emydomyces testavorans TaxID=2070801 RepID=A0AAF0ILH4_9EURO|nr:hypothetical protein PRK78_006280 [Emydomyces testavorans]
MESILPSAADSARSQPIPILPPPPTPFTGGPSRARRQLAARLAAQREAAEKATAESVLSKESSGSKDPGKDAILPNESGNSGGDASVSNPFLSIDEEKDLDPNTEMEFLSPFAVPGEGTSSSSPRHSFLPSFQPPSAYSSSSSDDDETIEAVQRNYRLPLEVYDDDEMGDMVSASAEFESYSDDDEDEETLIRETIGYSDFFHPERYTNNNASSSSVDGQNNNTDVEDEDLVEILVPGRRVLSN